MKQQSLDVIALGFDLVAWFHWNIIQLSHVAEHGDAALLERLLKGWAPAV